MKDQIKNASRIGITFGVVIIFIILIGLTVTASEIIGDIFNAGSLTRAGNTNGLLVFFALLGLWCGSMAAQISKDHWKPPFITGLVAGLTAGLLTGLMAYLLGDIVPIIKNLTRRYRPF